MAHECSDQPLDGLDGDVGCGAAGTGDSGSTGAHGNEGNFGGGENNNPDDEETPDDDDDDDNQGGDGGGGGSGDHREEDDEDQPPLPPHLPPFRDDNPTACLPTSLDSIPESAWATLGLDDSDVIALERRLLDFSTSRKLSSSQRAILFDHCTTITAEAITAAPSQAAARYYALFHLLPRMLVTETSLRRAKAAAPRPFWSQGKKNKNSVIGTPLHLTKTASSAHAAMPS